MSNEEIWKDVVGYEGLYQISSLGRLKSLERTVKHISKAGKKGLSVKKEKILKCAKDACGYMHARLAKDGKFTLYKVHHLVASAFLGYDRKQYDRSNLSESLVIDHLNRRQD